MAQVTRSVSGHFGSRRRGGHRPWSAVATLAAIVLLAGCTSAKKAPNRHSSGATGSSAASTPSGTLSVATANAPPSLDPVGASNSSVDEIDRAVYDTLVQYANGPSPKIVAQLAAKWTPSADGLSYDFTLRSGATFHDGSPLTAADVKFTLDRIKTVGTGIAAEMSAYASSAVVSPTELKVTLSKPDRPFLGVLSRVYVVEKKLVSAHLASDQGQAWLSTHEAGSGPYQLAGYTANSSTRLSYYKGYWGGWSGPHLAGVTVRYLGSGPSVGASLNSGEINFTGAVPASSMKSYQSNSKFTVDTADTTAQLYVAMNTATGPMQNKTLRQAVAAAFDYETFVNQVLYGAGAVAAGPLPSTFQCQSTNAPASKYDLAAAKRLVTEAGLEGTKVDIEYLPNLSEEKLGYDLLSSALTKMGLAPKAQPMAYPAYVQATQSASSTPDLAFVYTYPLFPDPNEVLYQSFDSHNIGGNNVTRYKDSTVDQLLEKAQGVADLAAACSDYEQAQVTIGNAYPTVNVATVKWRVVMTSKVHGYAYNVAHHKTENLYDMSIT